MLSSTHRQSFKQTSKRPFSAISAHSHRKEFRLTDHESLNDIKNKINQTFSNKNRYLKEVQQLTSSIDRKYEKRINRMCVTYSICKNPSKERKSFEGVDVDFITRKYINNKSKQKKKQQQRQILKKEVAKISRRYIKRQPAQFFKFDLETLRQMQHRDKQKKQGSRKRSHPYLSIYQQSQLEALDCLTDRNELNLGEINNYPAIGEPQQWQKEQKQIKRIYRGVSLLRKQKLKDRILIETDSERDHFYIT